MKNQHEKINLIWNLCLDISIGIVLAAALFPMAKWFYQANPPMGLDFYQFPSYVRYVSDHLTLPVLSWKNIWFDGVPLITDYSCLFFYLTIPFTKIWGLIAGSKILLLFSAYLYFWFSFLFLKELSKSRWFALAATIGLIWTTNYYSPMVSGGNVTYAATQFFLSLCLWLAVKYFQTKKGKYFTLLTLVAGLSYWGHAGTALIFIWVPVFLLLLFWWDEDHAFFSLKKIKSLLSFSFLSMAIGFLPLYAIAYLVITIPKAADFNFFQEGGLVHLEAIKGLFLTQNIFFFLGAVILFILAGFYVKQNRERRFVPLLALVFYILVFEWFYVIGRNPFAGGIMPPRTYWFLTISMAGLAALSWQVFLRQPLKTSKILAVLILIIFFLSPLCPSIDLNFKLFDKNLSDVGVSTNFRDYAPAQNTLVKSVVENTLQPGEINLDKLLTQKKILPNDLEKLKGLVIPQWFDFNDQQYRFHTLEVGVNIWWSVLFNMPITHGSYNSAHLNSNNYAYWTDAIFHGEMTTRWNQPVAIAKNDLLFLADWRSIRYLLGKEIEVKDGSQYSLGGSIADPSLLATYLTRDPNLVDRRGFEDKPVAENQPATGANLEYFRLKKEIVSPIVKTTNAPSILVVGNPLTAYENFIRNLAHLNLNSRFIIPIQGPKSLEKLSLTDLKKYEIVFMQYYQSNPQSWETLNKYVQEGGNLIIETGGDVLESNSFKNKLNKLPAVFPLEQTTRGSLGQTWNLTSRPDDPLVKEMSLKDFGLLKYNNDSWNISYSEPSKIKVWAHPVLSQNNKPFVVAGKLGKGQVVWSGLNLTYHYNQYFSQSEGQLLRNILSSMVNLEDEGTLNFQVQRPAPEKIIISGNNFKGAVLKENNYGGWSAKLVSPYKSDLKVENAGLGYAYTRLPEDVKGQAMVEFNYHGTFFNWFFFILAVVTFLGLMIKAILPNKTKNGTEELNLRDKIKGKVGSKLLGWWQADNEQ